MPLLSPQPRKSVSHLQTTHGFSFSGSPENDSAPEGPPTHTRVAPVYLLPTLNHAVTMVSRPVTYQDVGVWPEQDPPEPRVAGTRSAHNYG